MNLNDFIIQKILSKPLDLKWSKLYKCFYMTVYFEVPGNSKGYTSYLNKRLQSKICSKFNDRELRFGTCSIKNKQMIITLWIQSASQVEPFVSMIITLCDNIKKISDKFIKHEVVIATTEAIINNFTKLVEELPDESKNRKEK